MRVATLGQLSTGIRPGETIAHPYSLSAVAPIPVPSAGVYGFGTMTEETQMRLGVGVCAFVAGGITGYLFAARRKRRR